MNTEDTKQDVAIAAVAQQVTDMQAQIDRRFSVVDKNIDLILNNHLVHIQSSITKLKVQMALYAGGIGVGVWIIDKILK